MIAMHEHIKLARGNRNKRNHLYLYDIFLLESSLISYVVTTRHTRMHDESEILVIKDILSTVHSLYRSLDDSTMQGIPRWQYSPDKIIWQPLPVFICAQIEMAWGHSDDA